MVYFSVCYGYDTIIICCCEGVIVSTQAGCKKKIESLQHHSYNKITCRIVIWQSQDELQKYNKKENRERKAYDK